ncbi:2915_t:CDS:10 [Ambispora leptoticha]|uniref:2915_t:CDS:1 n=1 Tax=Ambispora leptoticha TaxID=144679 RepID=A0A9N9A3G2_9GLOM|nr:2915_t:CDS:10 [Ambispora leptoticha]
MSAVKAPFHTQDVQIDEDVQFEALITNPALLRGVSEAGYERPSPIQLKAIPPGKLGLDVIAQAKSGTGKTIVFSIVALETINLNVNKPQVLILSPTRELAVQTHKVILSIGRHMPGLNAHVFIGGMPVESDWPKLRKCHIVIGSPGRIELLLNQNKLNAKEIKLLVLDEADKLMEKNFRPQMQRLCKKLNEKKQVMAFSATYDKHLLNTLYRVMQYYQVVKVSNHDNVLDKYKFYEEKFKGLAALLERVPFYQCIVFLNHRGRAADLSDYLTKQGWMSMNISGGLDQKTRLTTMNKVRNFQLRVLVCSDLIARGIDIDRVNLVVNLDIPKDPETYLHRVGRTGRYGTHGLAISFVDEKEMGFINILQKGYSIEVKQLPEELSKEHHQRPLSTVKDQKAFERLEAIRNKVQMKGEEIPIIFTEDEKLSERDLKSRSENKEFEEENEYLGNNLQQFQTDYNYCNNHNYYDDKEAY